MLKLIVCGQRSMAMQPARGLPSGPTTVPESVIPGSSARSQVNDSDVLGGIDRDDRVGAAPARRCGDRSGTSRVHRHPRSCRHPGRRDSDPWSPAPRPGPGRAGRPARTSHRGESGPLLRAADSRLGPVGVVDEDEVLDEGRDGLTRRLVADLAPDRDAALQARSRPWPAPGRLRRGRRRRLPGRAAPGRGWP